MRPLQEKIQQEIQEAGTDATMVSQKYQEEIRAITEQYREELTKISQLMQEKARTQAAGQ